MRARRGNSQAGRIRLAYSLTANTATDFAGSFTINLPLSTFAWKGAGTMAFGDAKVLCASIAAAVSTLPLTALALAPATSSETFTASFGFVLTSDRYNFPSLPRAAEALTAGMPTLPKVYCGLLSSLTGSEVASWNGAYILN